MKIVSTILAVTAITVAAASAQPGRGDGSGPRGDKDSFRPKMERIADDLNLTAEQKQKLENLRDEFQAQNVDRRSSVQKAKLEVRRLLKQDVVDRDALMKAVEAEGAADLALRKARIEHLLKVRDIVGPENAERLRELRDERRGGQGPGRNDDDSDRPRRQKDKR